MAEEKITNVPADPEEGRVFVIESNRNEDLIKTVLLIVLIVFLPPAAIAVHANECNIHVLISCVLILFFVLPAYVHAIWYCFFRKPTNMTIS